MAKHTAKATTNISGVPGSTGSTGQESGGAGHIIPGGQSQKSSGGVNFFPTSAQFNPDPRKGVGTPAPHTKSTLDAPPHPASKSGKDDITIPNA